MSYEVQRLAFLRLILALASVALACRPEVASFKGGKGSAHSNSPESSGPVGQSDAEGLDGYNQASVPQIINGVPLTYRSVVAARAQSGLIVQPTVYENGKEVLYAESSLKEVAVAVEWTVNVISGNGSVSCPDKSKIVLRCTLSGSEDFVASFILKFKAIEHPDLYASYLFKLEGVIPYETDSNKLVKIKLLDLDLLVRDLPEPNLASVYGDHLAFVGQTGASRYCRSLGYRGGQVVEYSIEHGEAWMLCFKMRAASLVQVPINEFCAFDTSLSAGCKVSTNPVYGLALAGRYCRTKVTDSAGVLYTGGTWQEWYGSQNRVLLLCSSDAIKGQAPRLAPLSALNALLGSGINFVTGGLGSGAFLMGNSGAHRYCRKLAETTGISVISGVLQEVDADADADSTVVICL